MSIINDVLRKTPGKGKYPLGKTRSRLAPAPAPLAGRINPLLGLAIAVVAILIVVLVLLKKKDKEPIGESGPSATAGKPTASPFRLTGPRLNLNGIVFEPGSPPMAIINDDIVIVGDTIEGAKVVKITRDTVKLSFRGQEISLVLR